MSAVDRPGWVFFVSLALFTLFVVVGAIYPLELSRAATAALDFNPSHFGWFYLFATTAFLVCCVGIAFSSDSSMRLGADGEARSSVIRPGSDRRRRAGRRVRVPASGTQVRSGDEPA